LTLRIFALKLLGVTPIIGKRRTRRLRGVNR
jgi:hypothetical protein